MIAFVLSGGGNRGALQVGALQVLLERGIVPEMVVGTSVGAINGALVASDPTLAGARRLAELWREVTREDLYPGNHLTALWSVVRGKEGLFSNEKWRRFLSAHVPCETIGALEGASCYIIATELHTGAIHVFGEDPGDLLVDALMATCALPPLHPPYHVNGTAYIDGGTTANLPLRVALAKGATEIYALNIFQEFTAEQAQNLIGISTYAIGALLKRQIDLDLEHCASHENVRLQQVDLVYNGDLEPWDFSRTEELLALGREAAEVALSHPIRSPSWRERLAEHRERVAGSLSSATAHLGTLLWGASPAEQTSPIRSNFNARK